ncbi:MAG: hypothetical protein ACRBBN_20290 [Methyloligellaceae bacterium]
MLILSRYRSYFISVAFSIPFLFVLWAQYYPWKTGFRLNASAYYIQFHVQNTNIPDWHLKNVNLECQSQLCVNQFEGILKINRGVLVSFQSISKSKFEVRLEAQPNKTIGTLIDSSDEVLGQLPQKLLIEYHTTPMSKEGPVSFAVAGRFKVGKVIQARTSSGQSTITSGVLEVFGRPFKGRAPFRAIEYRLQPGESVTFGDCGKDCGIATGVITSTEESMPLSISLQAKAIEARIKRFGSNHYSISPSLWDRLVSDPILQAFGVIYLAMIPLLGWTAFSGRK